MEMQTHNTKVFNDVFPDYETFKNWIQEYSILVPRELTFKLIQAEYRSSHLAYDEISFKDHFFIDIYSFTREFEATTDAIDALMSLTDSQIDTDGSTVLNIAEIPSTENDTDAKIVNFVNQQQKTISVKGNLQIKREQLANKRIYTVKSFLKKFRHLFIKILSPAYTLVVAEEEHQ